MKKTKKQKTLIFLERSEFVQVSSSSLLIIGTASGGWSCTSSLGCGRTLRRGEERKVVELSRTILLKSFAHCAVLGL
jgi:hypothetical protein